MNERRVHVRHQLRKFRDNDASYPSRPLDTCQRLNELLFIIRIDDIYDFSDRACIGRALELTG